MIAPVRARMSAEARDVLDDAQRRADEALTTLAGSSQPRRLFVPGRVEVLGKHTDYAGGRSLTCAVERGFAVSYAPRDDGQLRLVDARDGRHAAFAASATLEPTTGQWSNYPMTVARRLARDFGALDRGADIGFFNTLPRAAGLSTSSALITAVYLVLSEVNNLAARVAFSGAIPDDLHLAGYLGSVENGQGFGPLGGDHGVGTFGGSEDHTAILLGEGGALGCYGYHPVRRIARVTLPDHLRFVVATSGIAADKTGGARDRYNRAAALVEHLIDRWRETTGRRDETLAAAIDSSPDALGHLRALAAAGVPWAPDALAARLEHFIVEDREILPASLDALEAGAWPAFGAWVDRSQRAAEELLGNQVPETVTLAHLAREHGALAASSFGAGFGGSVWALVEAAGAHEFLTRWMAGFAAWHPAAAELATAFVTRPGPGAGRN